MKLFGHYNQDRNRFSWSGSCIPKLNQWNFNGTMMRFNKKNDLIIKYRYSKDKRNDKITLMPNIFRENTNKSFLIVYWSYNKLKNHIEKKFNQKGFILFEKNKENIYYKMLIGKTINFNIFKNLMEKNDIIFDSGMHQGNYEIIHNFVQKTLYGKN